VKHISAQVEADVLIVFESDELAEADISNKVCRLEGVSPIAGPLAPRGSDNQKSCERNCECEKELSHAGNFQSNSSARSHADKFESRRAICRTFGHFWRGLEILLNIQHLAFGKFFLFCKEVTRFVIRIVMDEIQKIDTSSTSRAGF
jgi:hypothetical protein